MDNQIKTALTAGLKHYTKEEKTIGALLGVFDEDVPFLKKLKLMDEVFDENAELEDLREVSFDLLLMNFFSEDVQKLEEDYLDSPEWEAIEEQTIDRGTELLNVFLYLNECRHENLKPSLDDFLKEFLLVEEDGFQDEFSIYEKIISNQLLVESDYSQIAKVSDTLSSDEELFELFYPLMSFFYETDPDEAKLETYFGHGKSTLDNALYQILIHFNK